MADDNDKGGRSVRMYDRPADADKAKPPTMMIVLIVAIVLVAALLLARFVFHAFGPAPAHAAMLSTIAFSTHSPILALLRAAV